MDDIGRQIGCILAFLGWSLFAAVLALAVLVSLILAGVL